MSKDKTCLYICKPYQSGKTIEQLQLLINQGTTHIKVEESDCKKQRDALLEACKELLLHNNCLMKCRDKKEAVKLAKAAIEQAE